MIFWPCAAGCRNDEPRAAETTATAGISYLCPGASLAFSSRDCSFAKAYLAGVPEAIRIPRKEAAVRGVPAGSVLIGGQQCLVTTLTMPTGRWIIGRSPTLILDSASKERPFLFDVGDRVSFRRISRAQFDEARMP